MSDEQFKIEKDVPIPVKARTRLYPFRDMEVGDSFLVPLEADDDPLRTQNRITSAAQGLKPRKFSSRRVEGGIRVWRIADKPA